MADPIADVRLRIHRQPAGVHANRLPVKRRQFVFTASEGVMELYHQLYCTADRLLFQSSLSLSEPAENIILTKNKIQCIIESYDETCKRIWI